jgi:hypothetical protein
MYRVEFIYKGKTIARRIPADWNELSKAQLLIYCKYFLMEKYKTTGEFFKTISYHFLQAGARLFFKMNNAQLTAISEKLTFLIEECTLTDFPLNYFGYRFLKYYSPGKNLRFSTVEEIANADSYFQSFNSTKDDADLCRLIATLYRPVSIAGLFRNIFSGMDIRSTFNGYTVERRAKRFKSLSPVIKHAVFMQYMGCRAMNVKNNPELYKEGGKDKFGWAGTIISLAGPEIGTIEEVGKMLWNSALIYMRKIEDDRARQQEEYERQKNTNSSPSA